MSVIVEINYKPVATHKNAPNNTPLFVHKRNIQLIAEVIEIKRKMAMMQ